MTYTFLGYPPPEVKAWLERKLAERDGEDEQSKLDQMREEHGSTLLNLVGQIPTQVYGE